MGKYRKKDVEGKKIASVFIPRDREERRAMLREGLFSMSIVCGISEFSEMLDEEAAILAGPKGKKNPARQANHWGNVLGAVVLGGRKVRIERPRVRGKNGQEMDLRAYAQAQRKDLLEEAALERMLAGVATRSYRRSLDPLGAEAEDFGTSRSAVSRRIVRGTRRALDRMMGRRLDGLRIVAVMIDSLFFAEHAVVAALGVDWEGSKHVMGIWEGATENSAVAKALLSNLIERGLDLSGGCLFVIDGSKALRKAISDTFGDVPVQRCRVHKLRNVLDHLPHEEKVWVARKFRDAMEERSAATADANLRSLARALDGKHPGAAASLREGLEEVLTTKRLGIPALIERTLSSTNTIESLNSRGRTKMGNVKRWRGGTMIMRWSASAFEDSARTFRKVKGHREIAFLIAALEKRKEVAEKAKVA